MPPSATVPQRARLFANMKLLSYTDPKFDLLEFRDGAAYAYEAVQHALQHRKSDMLLDMVETEHVMIQLHKASYIPHTALHNVWVISLNIVENQMDSEPPISGAVDNDMKAMEVEVCYELAVG